MKAINGTKQNSMRTKHICAATSPILCGLPSPSTWGHAPSLTPMLMAPTGLTVGAQTTGTEDLELEITQKVAAMKAALELAATQEMVFIEEIPIKEGPIEQTPYNMYVDLHAQAS
jgi:hypothetical protein